MLTIDRAYFDLTGGLERWLYRIVRKHGGRQRRGWRFDFRHLHQKSGSLSPFKRFAFELRDIIHHQPLPGYTLFTEVEIGGRVLLAFEPSVPCGKPVEAFVPSGTRIGVPSGTTLPCHREPKRSLTHGARTEIRALNLESDQKLTLKSARARWKTSSATPPKASEPAAEKPKAQAHDTPDCASASSREREASHDRRVPQSEGRVGKTTLALNLAGAWARQGKRVTLIDADPQGSALDWSQQRAREGWPRLFGVVGLARDTLHREAPELARDADMIVIDGPPRVAALMRSALLASDLVLIPVQPSPFDLGPRPRCWRS